MNLLIITPFFKPNIGGVETFLEDLITELTKSNHSITVITYVPLTTKVKAKHIEKYKNVTIYRIPWLGRNLFYRLNKIPILQFLYLYTGLFFYTLYKLIFTRELKKIDAINVNGLASMVLGYILSKTLKKKYTLTFHTNYRYKKGTILANTIKYCSKAFDKIFVLSNSTKKWLIELNIEENRITVFKNWVNEEKFKILNKETTRKTLGLEKHAFYALFVGRFTPEKGIEDLINNIKNYKGLYKFIIVGSGIYNEEVTNLTKTNNNVVYLGTKKEEELIKLYNAADVLVYAPVDEDYLGRVSIAALQCGLPILIPSLTKYFNIKKENNIYLPKEVGLKFEEKNFNSILTLTSKHNLFNRQHCRRYIEQDYSRVLNSKKFINNLF